MAGQTGRHDGTVVSLGATQPHASREPTARVRVPEASIEEILEEIRKAPADRLDIERSAGAGGMGTIDVAIDRALDRRIALKRLHGHLRADDDAVRMFLREARLTGLLDHPHIVPIYDIGERGSEELYFAMKLVEGETLADMVRDLPRGPLETATLYALLDVFTKVCDALAFAHSRGVIHCDIKPANVMVGAFGQVYLMDWGIARQVALATSDATTSRAPPSTQAPRARRPSDAERTAEPSLTDNSVIGSPSYMSPEQARGDRSSLDARSDVFLMGALLYELLTRRPPYVSNDRAEVLRMANAAELVPPRSVESGASIHAELERIVLRAMKSRPDDRYPSVSALRDDVVRFMRGGGDFPRQSYGAGETIVREGEQGDRAYIIVAGECDVRKESTNGAEVLRSLGPGDVFGEMAIMTEGPRTATVVARTATTVLVVTSAVLEQEMAALKPWMAALLKSLAARFRDIDTHRRASEVSLPTPPRLANLVLMNLVTWGIAEGPRRSMGWSALAADLEAQLGVLPLALFATVSRYGMELDLEADRLTVPDVDALKRALASELLSPFVRPGPA